MRNGVGVLKYGNWSMYKQDNQFKVAIRPHQSRNRANVLKVDCLDYGNRLTESDGRVMLYLSHF